MLGFLVNVAGSVFLARALGPAAWGIFSAAYTFQYIAQGIVERGMVGLLVHRTNSPTRAQMGTAFIFQAGLGALGLALMALIAPHAARAYGEASLGSLLLAVGLSTFAFAIRALPMGLLERDLRFRRIAAVELFELVTFNVVAVATVAAGLGVGGLALAMVLRAFASTAVSWSLVRVRLTVQFSAAEMREIVRFAGPYAASNALGYLNAAAVPVLVGTFAGARQLGILQMAYSLVLYPQVLMGILGRIAFPAFSRMGDIADVRTGVNATTVGAIRFLGGATLLIAATGPLWIEAIYGAEWGAMAPAMLTLALTVGLFSSFTFVIAALNSRGHAAAVLSVGTGFSLLLWLGGLLLVPLVGMLGLVLAQTVAYSAFIGYLSLYRVRIGEVAIRRALTEYLIMSCVAVTLGLWQSTRAI